MCENSYLSDYRRFFDEYVKTVDPNDPLPLRVASYGLLEDELLGQVVDCCIQYLYFINCPSSLVTHLSKLAVDEVYGEYKKAPLPHYETLKVMQTVTKTVAEICRRHLDNETLSKLPPPPNEPLVSALGIKHTRRNMEDRMVYIPRLNHLFNKAVPHEAAYYAIFDGHNGVNAATYAVSHLHQFLVDSPHYPDDVEAAFRDAYAKTDQRLTDKEVKGGSTSIAILHEPAVNKLTVSWLGDSQAMLIKAGRPVMLVDPHRPERPDEAERILKSGFIFEVHGIHRINGALAVSRALGDEKFKPMVSSEPDVLTLTMDGTEDALILGCDGFWDVLNPRQVCDTFYFQTQSEPDRIDLLSRRLVDLAKEFDSTDNISVIAVLLKPPSELTPPQPDQQSSATMETPELEPFRTNGSHHPGPKHEDEDFGPETDVDAPDDGNPFGSDSRWTRPDPLQTFSDLSGMKPSPGIRFSDFTALDNPFSNSLHDIAEEKAVEDAKPEKEKLNNNGIDFVSNGVKDYGNDPFGFGDFGAKTNDLSDETFIFSSEEKSAKEAITEEKAEVRPDLPDVVNVQDVEMANKLVENDLFTAAQCSEKIDLPKTFGLEEFDTNEQLKESERESKVFEQAQSPQKAQEASIFEETPLHQDVEISSKPTVNDPFEGRPNVFESHVDDDPVNPFDRATPEPAEEVVKSCEDKKSSGEVVQPAEEKKPEFEAEKMVEDQVQLETLKSMMLAEESVNEDVSPVVDAGGFPVLSHSEEAMGDSTPTSPFAERVLDEPVEFDGELAVDDVVETGGDGEESEEEWDYYKVDQNKPPPSQLDESEQNMNSPLNPDAAEFVPPSGLVEKMTPVKGIPPGLLDDIVASSPNWASMDDVQVPDVDTFLEGAKARPGDVTLDPDVEPFEMPTLTTPAFSAPPEAVSQLPGIEGVTPFEYIPEAPLLETALEPIPKTLPDLEVLPQLVNQTETPVQQAEPEVQDRTATPEEGVHLVDLGGNIQIDVAPVVEPRGLDLATDMTSSFIDPSTMGGDVEDPTQEIKQNSLDDSKESPSQVLAGELQKLSIHDESLINQEEPKVSPAEQTEPKAPENVVTDVREDIQIATENTQESPRENTEKCPTVKSEGPEESLEKVTAESFEEPTEPSTPKSTVAEPASTPPSTPLTAELTPAAVPDPDQLVEVVEKLSASEVASVAAAAVVGAAAVGVAAKKSPTKTSSPTKAATPRSSAAAASKPAVTTTPRTAPAKKPATPTTTRTPLTKPPATKTPVTAKTSAPKPAPAKPTTTTTTAPPKPKTSVTAKVSASTTVAAKPAAPKPAVKTTIPPRTTAPTRPRVPSAPTGGLANGDLKAQAAKKSAEPVVKKTATPTNRVPLSSRPATAPTTKPPAATKSSTVATKTTTTARPTSAKPATTAAAAAKPKPTVAAAKKPLTSVTAPKTNGVSKPAPIKRAVPSAKAESKTEVKTATKTAEAPAVVSNGVSAATE